MPHDVTTAKGHDRKRSLGWLATAWLEHFVLHGPGDVQGLSVAPIIDEYVAFVVDTYAHDEDGKRLYDHVFLSRPKGCAKSEVAALIAMFEAVGPCRFDGFAEGGEVFEDPWGSGFRYVYEAGEPMGKKIQSPFIRCMSTAEDQSGLVYDTIYLNFNEGPLAAALDHPDQCGLARIAIPGGGEVVPSSAGSASKDGGKDTLAIFDETHLYNLPNLRQMYKTVTRNLVKRRKSAGTFAIETTTMYAPGEDSIAEQTYKLVQNIRAGKVKGRNRQLFDHRFGDITPEQLEDEKLVREALVDAFGDCTWNDIDGLVDEIYSARDPGDITSMFRYWFNSPFSAENAWIASWEWLGCGPIPRDDWDEFDTDPNPPPIRKGDVIVMGFDGSRRRRKGVTDSTALIGCRVSDGVMFPIRIWEQPMEYKGDGWEVDTGLVDERVKWAFKNFNVVGFYADPALWETWISKWESRYLERLKLKATTSHPIEWWMTGGSAPKTVQALREFQNAVLDRELTWVEYDQSDILTAHVLNARRKETTAGTQIGKENPDSRNKIDAAVAAVIAWQARLDAVAKGLATTPKKRTAYKVR